MSTIQIRGISKGDKRSVFVDHQLHKIFIGSTRVLMFENYQEAEAMIASINKYLTDELYEMLIISSGLYGEYVSRMMYLDDYRLKVSDIYTCVHENVAWVLEHKRNLIYTWNRLQLSCDELSFLTKILLDYELPKRSFHSIRAIEYYADRLNAIKNRMDEFPAFPGPFTIKWY